jgi:cytochrome P450
MNSIPLVSSLHCQTSLKGWDLTAFACSWNAGPRTCLGKALATHEAISVVAAVVPQFDIFLEEPDKVYESQPGLNMVSILVRVPSLKLARLKWSFPT